jgi:hypothetical protein
MLVSNDSLAFKEKVLSCNLLLERISQISNSPFILYLDEGSGLFSIADGNFTNPNQINRNADPFLEFRRCIGNFVNGNFLCVLVDTSSNVSKFSPASCKDPSDRVTLEGMSILQSWTLTPSTVSLQIHNNLRMVVVSITSMDGFSSSSYNPFEMFPLSRPMFFSTAQMHAGGCISNKFGARFWPWESTSFSLQFLIESFPLPLTAVANPLFQPT